MGSLREILRVRVEERVSVLLYVNEVCACAKKVRLLLLLIR